MVQALLKEVRARGAAVPEVHWALPGEDAGLAALLGLQGFLTPSRLALYDTKRNDPGAKVTAFPYCCWRVFVCLVIIRHLRHYICLLCHALLLHHYRQEHPYS